MAGWRAHPNTRTQPEPKLLHSFCHNWGRPQFSAVAVTARPVAQSPIFQTTTAAMRGRYRGGFCGSEMGSRCALFCILYICSNNNCKFRPGTPELHRVHETVITMNQSCFAKNKTEQEFLGSIATFLFLKPPWCCCGVSSFGG